MYRRHPTVSSPDSPPLSLIATPMASALGASEGRHQQRHPALYQDAKGSELYFGLKTWSRSVRTLVLQIGFRGRTPPSEAIQSGVHLMPNDFVALATPHSHQGGIVGQENIQNNAVAPGIDTERPVLVSSRPSRHRPASRVQTSHPALLRTPAPAESAGASQQPRQEMGIRTGPRGPRTPTTEPASPGRR